MIHGSVQEIRSAESGDSSSGGTDVIRVESQDAQTRNSIQECSPEMSELSQDPAKFVEEKCWSKLTWYHFAAIYLHPLYKEHDSLKLNNTEKKTDRVQLDIKGLQTEMEEEQVEAPPRKKLKTVLLSISDDDECGPETEDITITVSETTFIPELISRMRSEKTRQCYLWFSGNLKKLDFRNWL